MTWKDNQITKLLEAFKSQEISILDKEIEDYPEIKKLLNTKLKDMENNPKYKKYLNLAMPSDREKLKNHTLHDMMVLTVNAKPYNIDGEFDILYSYNKEYPIGWFTYYHSSTNLLATSIKMFSFGTNDLTFMKDVKKKFNEICDYYVGIEWTSVKTNPFIKHYIKAMIKYKGKCFEIEDGEGIKFIIDKRNPCNDYSFLESIFSEEILNKIKV